MRSLLLAFCCFSAVRLVVSEVLEVSSHVGGNVTISCFGGWSPVNISEHYTLLFCRGVCSDENTIIRMGSVIGAAFTRDWRYSMKLAERDEVLTVTINQLRKADTGNYLCEMRRTFNISYQEISLKVLDAFTVPAGSPNTTQQTRVHTPRGSISSSDETSHMTETMPPSERKRRQKEVNNFTDMMVVIIISGSLAFLVCAIIPLIFYRHWRIMAGQNKQTANKNEDDCCQENIYTTSTQVALGLQTSEEQSHPESGKEENIQYAAVYEGLDPKTLE